MNHPDNKPIKDGYMEAVDILFHNRRSYHQISKDLENVQTRAIAVLAVDYLNGEEERRVILNFRPKKIKK